MTDQREAPWWAGPPVKTRQRGRFDAYGNGTWWTMSICRHCAGRGYCRCAFGCDPEWCCDCGGASETLTMITPPMSTPRLAAMLTEALRGAPMADQREAVDIVDAVDLARETLHQDECDDETCSACDGGRLLSPRRTAVQLARAVIALDEEVRRLRGEAERHAHQCICMECGLNVKADADLCCATCGRDVIVVTHGQVWPDSFQRVVNGEIDARRCDALGDAQPAPPSPGASAPTTPPLCPACGEPNMQIAGMACYACAHKDDPRRDDAREAGAWLVARGGQP